MILQGDARARLRELDDASVQCVVTSPPYWGLRDYGIPPSVWGGDPECRHRWGPGVPITSTSGMHRMPASLTGGAKDYSHRAESHGNFCECGAWRGCLGLEPTPGLYVTHVAEVFRDVRRVLRDDGVLWLNLGDCYATGGGKVGECPGGGKQGERWAGRGMNTKQPKWAAALGPICQPNRMPIDGLKAKDLVGIPWRVAFALQADGWYLRSDIIWHKPNPMPESVRDRPTRAHEYIFLLAKSERYFYDADAIAEPCVSDHDSGNKARKLGDGRDSRLNTHIGRSIPWNRAGRGPSSLGHRTPNGIHGPSLRGEGRCGDNPSGYRNRRSVWTITTRPYKGAHFATFPPALVEPCVLAGSRAGDVVLDPFAGSGTVAMVAEQLGREWIAMERKPEYCKLIEQRVRTARRALEAA
jgi:DNA modification methylase